MMSAILLMVLCQVAGDGWHYEQRCNGRSCWLVKVADPPAAAAIPQLATKRLPELLAVPPAPVVKPLPIERQYYFGVDESHKASRDTYKVGDVEVTRDELSGAMDGDSSNLLPADSSKPHLSLFGRDEKTRSELETLMKSADAAPLKEAYRVQVYDASHKIDREMVGGFNVETDKRFLDSGRVAVLQPASKTGEAKVLGALFAFNSAGDVAEWVPKVDPNFKLPHKPVPDPHPANGEAVDPWVVVLLLAGVVLAFVVGQVVFSNPSGARQS